MSFHAPNRIYTTDDGKAWVILQSSEGCVFLDPLHDLTNLDFGQACEDGPVSRLRETYQKLAQSLQQAGATAQGTSGAMKEMSAQLEKMREHMKRVVASSESITQATEKMHNTVAEYPPEDGDGT
jgi:methyl-accepting chemotaxis protein